MTTASSLGQAGVITNRLRDSPLDTIRMIRPGQTSSFPSPDRVPVAEGSGFAAAPLLTVRLLDEVVLVVIGTCHVEVDGSHLKVTAVVNDVWAGTRSAETGGYAVSRLEHVTHHDSLSFVVEDVLGAIHVPRAESRAGMAVAVAKGIAEHSRNAVEDLRGLRYEAERHLANSIADDSYEAVNLPALIELSIAAGRARDNAARAVREGLWIYRCDDHAYHAHRRMLDPTLAARDETEVPPASLIRVLDAGVRQARTMENLLTDELEQMHRLIQATASISAARDVSAQEQFNFVATVGAVVLGLPALVLSVYGSRAGSDWPWAWVLPVVLCGVLACVVAWKIPGDLGTRRRRRSYAVVAAGVTFLLVCVAAGVPRLLVFG